MSTAKVNANVDEPHLKSGEGEHMKGETEQSAGEDNQHQDHESRLDEHDEHLAAHEAILKDHEARLTALGSLGMAKEPGVAGEETEDGRNMARRKREEQIGARKRH